MKSAEGDTGSFIFSGKYPKIQEIHLENPINTIPISALAFTLIYTILYIRLSEASASMMSMNTYSNRQLDSSIKSSDSENAHSSWNLKCNGKPMKREIHVQLNGKHSVFGNFDEIYEKNEIN